LLLIGELEDFPEMKGSIGFKLVATV
jgi:hypothetical protein